MQENLNIDQLEEFEKNSAFYKKGGGFVKKLNGEFNDNSLVMLKKICKINDVFFEYFYDSTNNKNNFLLLVDDGLYIELLAYHLMSAKIFSYLSEDVFNTLSKMLSAPIIMVIDSKKRGTFAKKIKCSGTTETIDEMQRFMICLDGYIGVTGACKDFDGWSSGFSARIKYIAERNLKALSKSDQKTISESVLVDINKFSEEYSVHAIKEIKRFFVEFSETSTDAPKNKPS